MVWESPDEVKAEKANFVDYYHSKRYHAALENITHKSLRINEEVGYFIYLLKTTKRIIKSREYML